MFDYQRIERTQIQLMRILDRNSKQKIIDSILVALTVILGAVKANGSGNLLINGNFSQPPLLGLNYTWVYQIPGWTSSQHFQLFPATVLNGQWYGRAFQGVQIANSQKQTFWQIVVSNYDYYTLYLQYAGNPFFLFETTQANVFFNGILVKHLSVTDYLINNTTIILISNSTVNQLKFQPSGNSVFDGIALSNMEMIGFCNPKRTYSFVEEKCMWDAITNCLLIDQATGSCTQCSPGLYPQRNICKCSQGFYLLDNACKPCLLPCKQCQRSSRNCLSCPSFYHFSQQNQCVIQNDLIFSLALAISLPGFEQTSFGSFFVGNLDQFWPYYSHHREYGNQTGQTLQLIHTLQNSKWLLNSFDKKIDFNFQQLNFSDFSLYSNRKFLQKENRTSYFWDGAFQILFYCFPVSLLVFFALHKFFYLTFKYRVSRHFRLYSFYFMIYVMGFEGDIYYLSFLSFSNAINLFSFKFQDKFGHIIWVFIFFLLVFFCSGSFFVAKILYNKLSKYFFGDLFCFVESIYVLSFIHSKAMIIGAANAFLASNYEALIISLCSIQVFGLIVLAYFQSKFRCFKLQAFMYTLMLKSIIMAFFNILLLIQWKVRKLEHAQTDQEAVQLLDLSCKVLIIISIGLGSLQIVSTYFCGRKRVTVENKIIQKDNQKDLYNSQNKKEQKNQKLNSVALITAENQDTRYKNQVCNKVIFNTRKREKITIQGVKKHFCLNQSNSINNTKKAKQKYKRQLKIACQQVDNQNLQIIFLER